jgi:DNA-binding transcriptional MerR regulator
MTLTDDRLSIAQVAEATGLSTHALRYYERAGLMLEPVDRASSSHRRYSPGDVNWVEFLSKLRSTGMPIATVREYTDLVRRGDATTEDRLELLGRHRIAVLAQLDEITRSLAAIDKKIALYKEKATHA